MRPKTKDGEKLNLFLDRETKVKAREMARRKKVSVSQFVEGLINRAASCGESTDSVEAALEAANETADRVSRKPSPQADRRPQASGRQ